MRREAVVEAGKAEHRAADFLAGPRRVRVAGRSSLAPGQVHARERDGPADDLLHSQHLPEKHDARGDPREGDQVLVDEHPVGPDAGDAPSLTRRSTVYPSTSTAGSSPSPTNSRTF